MRNEIGVSEMTKETLMPKSSLKTGQGAAGAVPGKTAFCLPLPPFLSHFCGRRCSPLAVAARRRGNAAGVHGGKRKYGKRERRASRREEQSAKFWHE